MGPQFSLCPAEPYPRPPESVGITIDPANQTLKRLPAIPLK